MFVHCLIFVYIYEVNNKLTIKFAKMCIPLLKIIKKTAPESKYTYANNCRAHPV